MFNIDTIKNFLKNGALKIFKYQGIFIFLFIDDDLLKSFTMRKSEIKHEIFIMKKDKLKKFYGSGSRICFRDDKFINYSKIINKVEFKYKIKANIKKLIIITEDEDEKYTRLNTQHIQDKNIMEKIINDIKSISFAKNFYNPYTIRKCDNFFFVEYYDLLCLNSYDHFSHNSYDMRLKIYENEFEKSDKFFEMYCRDDEINFYRNSYNKFLNKYSLDETELKVIEFSDVSIPKNIIDEIVSDKEKFINKSKKILEWLNYYQINNFYDFEYYDLKINYLREAT